MDYRHDIANIYRQILEEGIEEKIPKLLQLVRPDIEDKESYIRWAAETFDPSKNAAYITWILRMLKKGVIVGEEDAQKVQERLTQFEELKKKPQFPKDKRDINAYKTYGDLAEILDQFQGIKTKGEIKREAQEEGIEFMGSSGGREGSGISLYIVTSDEAAAKHFRNTDWCVKDPRYFNNYGPPYYYFTENGQPNTLLHLDSQQCMDVRDRPTDLDDEEKNLMETEEMTNYVMENDNSDKALAFYSEKVGGGYDEKIHNFFWSKLEKMVDNANKNLKMFHVLEPWGESIEYYSPEAYGSIPYDMTQYEQYINDRNFLKTLVDVLGRCDIYVGDDWIYDNNQVSKELDHIYPNMKYDDHSSYRNESIIDKMVSFISELKNIEKNFDPEEFDEYFKDGMIKSGYLSSGWGDFTKKVSINSLNFNNFKRRHGGSCYDTESILISDVFFKYAQRSSILDVDNFLYRYTRQDHPYVLLVEFLKPFIQRGLATTINHGARTIEFSYNPSYGNNNKTEKQYIRELKAVKDFDVHFDFYIDQIRRFMNKFVYPYLQNFEDTGSYGIPENIKLPFIQIKNRKEDTSQGMLELHETRNASDYFN